MKEFFWGGGGHACGFIFNFSKVADNAIITYDKAIDFFPTSLVILLLTSLLYSFSINFSSWDLSCELRVLIKRDSIFA